MPFEDQRLLSGIFFYYRIILAVGCIIYGIKILSVRSGTGFFMVWFMLGAIFVFFAGAAWFGIWGKLPGVLRMSFIGIVSVWEKLK